MKNKKIVIIVSVLLASVIVGLIISMSQHTTAPYTPSFPTTTAPIQPITPTIYKVEYCTSQVTIHIYADFTRVWYVTHNQQIKLLNATINGKIVIILGYGQECCDLAYSWQAMKTINITLTFNNGIANFTK